MHSLHQQYKKQQQLIIRKTRLYQLFIIIGLLIAWEITTSLRLLDPLIFSSPQQVFQLLIAKLADGTLLPHITVTFFETIVGFLLGTLFGTLLAIFLWSSTTVAKVLDPFLVVLNAMPKVALGPMILVIFGPNMLTIIAMGIFISVIISTLVIFSAFQQVDPHYLKVMQLFQARKWQTFQHVIFPASLPTIISTLKVNVGLSWVGVIVGEFLVSTKGLGYLIISGFQVFNFHLVFLALFVIMILATCMYKAVEYTERMLLKKFHHKT